MKTVYDTYCGLYCGACPVLVANEEGVVEKRAVEWKMNADKLRCLGCKTDTTAFFCADCRIRVCARERGVEFCSECADYPCEILVDFRNDEHPHHSAVLDNLERIREEGLDGWLEEQRKRWSCVGCGIRFTWYDEKCRRCGAELFNCRDEERDRGTNRG